MNDPAPRSLYVVFSNPLGDEDALHTWYEDVHIPDSLEAGLFESVARYRAEDDLGARYLTLWGCDYASERDALAAVRPVAVSLRERGRIEVVQEVVFQQFVFLESEAGAGDVRGADTLAVGLSTWSRPSSVAAFEEALTGDRAGGAVRYGVPAPRRKAMLLSGEATWPTAVGVHGLPPFGEPTPIFQDGSPAPGPVASSADEVARREASADVWTTRWERLSLR